MEELKATKKMEAEKVQLLDGGFVWTGWPLMKQLDALGAKIRLTNNDPYPCFMVECKGSAFLFTPKGGKVSTMLGDVHSFAFDEVVDFRKVLTIESL